ncbi:GNAT family N-acetyltransferase [Microbacterium marinilacus]|uniref:GNAT family N-acetyltransferase n=1 Tax=Microbacterium marinilacus TaxID=415209 RepID=A0ABP7BS52_9MICO|nr:GNAT family N-acetyltransferase [Microbacterium marinilacus]MBY0689837.1 GNAT family N-acetyltransferase [Microbacterium marinilacus]
MDIRLREVGEDDLEVLFAFEQEPEAVSRSRFPPRDHDRFMAHWRANVMRGDGVLVRAVVVDGTVAGSLVTWDEDDGRRFLGYWLGRAFWGRGIGTAALRAFLGIDRSRPLHADPHEGNTASRRVLERVGFADEGVVLHGAQRHVLYVLR